MSEVYLQAGNEMPSKKQKLSSDENSNPDLSGDENVSTPPCLTTTCNNGPKNNNRITLTDKINVLRLNLCYSVT